MLAIFSLQSMLLSLDALLFGILGIMSAQSHTLLSAVENSLYLFAIGAVFHFVLLTYTRALDASGLLADPFSQLQNYKGQYWFWVWFIYSLPLASVGNYAYLVFRTWQAHPSESLVYPPMPSMGSLYSFNLCWFFLFAIRAVALLAMKQFVEPGQLLVDVKNRLRATVDAESVDFMPAAPASGNASKEFVSACQTIQHQLVTAEIPVFTADRAYGVLQFGKRTGRFRYQSENLAFMTTAARRLAEMLRNFELRSERAAQQQREQHLRTLAEQAELRALRAQINPHFLFNALNSLAELTQEDPKSAENVGRSSPTAEPP
jgi:hypothetical protein